MRKFNYFILVACMLFIEIMFVGNVPAAVRSETWKYVEDVKYEIQDVNQLIVDSHTLEISGKIIKPTVIIRYQDIEETSTQKREGWYTYDSWTRTRDTSRKGATPWNPSKCKINTDKIKRYDNNIVHPELKEVLKVEQFSYGLHQDETFKVMVTIKEDFYFHKPKLKKYYQIRRCGPGIALCPTHVEGGCTTLQSLKVGGTTKYRDVVNDVSINIPLGDIYVYYYVLDTDSIGKLIASMVNPCRVNFEFREQLTRREVSPDITITPVSALAKQDYINSFKAKLEQEFDNDWRLVDKVMETLNTYLNKNKEIIWDNKIEATAQQSISFVGLAGCEYKIETIHSDYIYFRGLVSPASSKTINKTVLLVEKGEKLRLEQAKDGEGGSMVDN